MEDCPNAPRKDGHVVASLGAARFQKASENSKKPIDTQITDVFEAAMAFHQQDPSDHIVIIMSKDIGNGGTNTRFLQAGTMNSLAQFGMLHTAMDQMMQSGKSR